MPPLLTAFRQLSHRRDAVGVHPTTNARPPVVLRCTQHTGPVTAAALLGLAKLAVFWALALPFDFPARFCQWDCGWYVSIALHGYQQVPLEGPGAGQANWAFFPLYPLMLRAGMLLLPDPHAAGLLVSTVCALGLAAAGTCYALNSRPQTPVWMWPLLITVWPFGFYWQAPLAEGIYALLVIFALMALLRDRLLLAALATALLSAARPTGILLAVWTAARSIWCGLGRLRATPRPSLIRIAADALLPVSVAPLGLVAFGAYLGWKLGDPLAFSHVHAGWHHNFTDPLTTVLEALQPWQWASLQFWRHPPLSMLFGAFALAGLSAGGLLAWRRRYAEAVLIAGTVLLALCTGVVSMLRYVGANPVLLLAVGDLLGRLRSRPLTGALLIGMAVLQLVLLHAWFEASFVVM